MHTPTPTPTPTMPNHARDNEVLERVMHEHRVSQAEVADGTGISSSFLSRVLSGQYSVPPAVIRFLFQRTLDERVARIALGEQGVQQLRSGAVDRTAAMFRAARSLGVLTESIGLAARGGCDREQFRGQLREAVNSLTDLDNLLKVDLVA